MKAISSYNIKEVWSHIEQTTIPSKITSKSNKLTKTMSTLSTKKNKKGQVSDNQIN